MISPSNYILSSLFFHYILFFQYLHFCFNLHFSSSTSKISSAHIPFHLNWTYSFFHTSAPVNLFPLMLWFSTFKVLHITPKFQHKKKIAQYLNKYRIFDVGTTFLEYFLFQFFSFLNLLVFFYALIFPLLYFCNASEGNLIYSIVANSTWSEIPPIFFFSFCTLNYLFTCYSTANFVSNLRNFIINLLIELHRRWKYKNEIQFFFSITTNNDAATKSEICSFFCTKTCLIYFYL